MRKLIAVAACFTLVFGPQSQSAELERVADGFELRSADWPWWRGPHRNGVADADQLPPVKWDLKQNIVWKQEIPGRGHGSTTVFGDQVFLATANHDTNSQSVLSLDRRTGKVRWTTEVHRGGLTQKGNKKASQASSTVACDGKRLFINFLHADAIHTSALTLDGKILWQTKITDYIVHQGYGSSPALYQSLVLVSADNKGGGAVVALDRESGKTVWKRERPEMPNYPSPIILRIHGRDQLLLTGCDLVTSLDPLTGTELWEISGATTECVTSTVTDGERIFTSGGYPKNHMAAVRADGSGTVEWESTTRVYVPSMLVRDGYIYCVADAGVAMCFESKSGKEIWKGRLGGTFSASPVLVGDTIFATNESGETFLFRARPDEFKLLGSNQLGDHVMATPTICGGRIYMRVAEQSDDRRQEWLYCIGE